MNRKTYETPLMTIECFEEADVIVTSGGRMAKAGGKMESQVARFAPKPKSIQDIGADTDWIDIRDVAD